MRNFKIEGPGPAGWNVRNQGRRGSLRKYEYLVVTDLLWN